MARMEFSGGLIVGVVIAWLLFRFSGTEPLLRIYTEVQDKELVQKLLAAGKELVGL